VNPILIQALEDLISKTLLEGHQAQTYLDLKFRADLGNVGLSVLNTSHGLWLKAHEEARLCKVHFDILLSQALESKQQGL
jgi:hypothetical protein